jgi:anti-sigma B factor antagonist
MSLEIKARPIGAVEALDLSGRLTSGSGTDHLRDAIRLLADSGRVKVLLNLEAVTFVDSAGLGSLAVCADLLRNRGGLLRIMHPQSPVRRVLQTTRLDTVFPPYEDEKAALASFQ